MILDEFKNKFQLSVDKCSEVRYYINNVLWKNMKNAKKAFSTIFGMDPSWYSALNDAYHYRNGGYPFPDSPPRYQDAANRLAKMFLTLKFADMEEMVNKYLRVNYGLELVEVNPVNAIKRQDNLTEEKINGFIKEDPNIPLNMEQSDKELFKNMLEYMDNLQTDICQNSNFIKRDKFKELKDEFPDVIKKGHFLTSVGLGAIKLKNEDKFKKKKNVKKEYNETEIELIDLV